MKKFLFALSFLAVILTNCGGSSISSNSDVTDIESEKISDMYDIDVMDGSINIDITGIKCETDDDCKKKMGLPGECETIFCEPTKKICVKGPLKNYSFCGKDNPCIETAYCMDGVCIPVIKKECDDGNPCTNDYCDELKGCVFEKISGKECDDGNDCTIDDECVDGVCIGKPTDSCKCVYDFECKQFDDDDLCNGEVKCINNKCVLDPDTIVKCDEIFEPCKKNVCNPKTGQCEIVDVADGSPCDDGNSCTIDDSCENGECVPGKNMCECTVDADCELFNDDNLCNGIVRCIDNKCLLDPDTIVKCDSPDNPCLVGYCDAKTGKCNFTNKPDGVFCNDNDLCTKNDVCINGKCVGEEIDCDDGNPCTDDYCEKNKGCLHFYNTKPCDDSNLCTENDVCFNGVCVGTKSVFCNDQNPCTKDSCDPEKGCIFEPQEGDCSDGDDCTAGDHCENGFCVPGTENICISCSTDEECEVLNDDNLCNGVYKCISGKCKIDETTIVVCDGENDTPCKKTKCNPETGKCELTVLPDGVFCVSENKCLKDTICINGECVGTPINCNDFNPCTDDFCDEETGECKHTFNNNPCDDNDSCTEGDFCKNGVCMPGENYVCKKCEVDSDCAEYDDKNPCNGVVKCINGFCVNGVNPVVCDSSEDTICMKNTCNPDTGKCEMTPVNDGESCNDYNICTQDDRCENGKCVGGSPIQCDDNNPCTKDYCDPVLGCKFEILDGTQCNDGNLCTTDDHCVEGKCVGKVVTCDDSEDTECMKNLCDKETGVCKLTPVNEGESCDDKNLCTTNDVCVEGECKGEDVECDDTYDNECRKNQCNPETGECEFVFINEGKPCDDGNLCTINDICIKGECTSNEKVVCEPSNEPCKENQCNPETGGCELVTVSDGTPCDDNNLCTEIDVCINGVCVGTDTKDCDDKNPCTEDFCEPETGECQHNEKSCDDNNQCTEDMCDPQTGNCQHKPVVCDDGNVCTTDKCEPDKGCVFINNNELCDDGNQCTVDDHCENGKCVGTNICECMVDSDCEEHEDGNLCNGTLICDVETHKCVIDPDTVVVCDDSLNTQCEKNVCNPDTGKCELTPVPDGTPCDDSNLCTLNDTCVNGKCKSSQVKVCPPLNEQCKINTCNPDTGKCEPVFVENGKKCNDNNLCTKNDVCIDGVCTGTETVNCSDGNLCTEDKCIPESGCVHLPLDCNDNNLCTNDSCNSETGCVFEPVDCDDGNICTDDKCAPDTGCYYEFNNNSCNDGNECTINDHCENGECVGENICQCMKDEDCKSLEDGDLCNGTLVCDQQTHKCVIDPATVVVCDSSNDTDCLKNVCNPKTGKCAMTPVPDGTECDDGNLCTTVDVCKSGTCLGYEPKVCNDNNACTKDYCLKDTGCVFEPISCDDNSLCTIDSCDPKLGCVYTPVNCDDGNECTDDFCYPDTGCAHTYNNASCDDGNECTVNDHCENGMCVGVNTCQCFTDKDCEEYENGNLCDGTLVCDTSTHKCVVDPDTVVVCDPTNDTDCMKNTCDPDTGTCSMTPVEDGTLCNDGSACTTGDHCLSGECIGDAVNCDDNNLCTDDSCDPDTGCVHELITCDDGNLCTIDSCDPDTGCVFAEKVCDDNNVCTDDFCNEATGECDTIPLSGISCNDNNPCTSVDECINGVCTGTNDVCCKPQKVIKCGDVDSRNLNIDPNTTDTIDEYSCYPGVDYTGKEFTYSFKATCSGTVTVKILRFASDSNDLLQLDLLVLDATNPDVCLGENCITGAKMKYEYVKETWVGTGQASFSVVENNRYFIVVDGENGDEGDFEIEVNCNCNNVETVCDDGVDNDSDTFIDCNDSDCFYDEACLNPGECKSSGTINCNSKIYDEIPDQTSTNNINTYSCVPAGDPSNWEGPEKTYTFVSNCNGNAIVSLYRNKSKYGKMYLDLFILQNSNEECNAENCIVYDKMKYVGETGLAQVEFPVSSGEKYYIVVDGRNENYGDFVLQVDCDCASTETVCDDGIDNDNDGNTDCFDLDCLYKPCNDGDLCTVDDICSFWGWCEGTLKDCDDNNVCTDDSCVDGVCVNEPNNDPCDDGDECTIKDVCSGGVCTGGENICCCCNPVTELKCGIGMVDSLNSSLATDSVSKYSCSSFNYDGNEVAYTFKAPCSGKFEVTLTLKQQSWEIGFIDLFLLKQSQPNNCSGTDCVGFGAMDSTKFKAKLIFDAVEGDEFIIVADGRNGYVGDYTISVKCPEDCVTVSEICNNGIDDDKDGYVDCADIDCISDPFCQGNCTPVKKVSCNSTFIDSNTSGMNNIEKYDCASTTGYVWKGNERTYQFIAPCTGSVVVKITKSNTMFNKYLDLFLLSGDSYVCKSKNCFKYGEMKASSSNTLQAVVKFYAIKDKNYYIVVDGRWLANADYTFSISCECSD